MICPQCGQEFVPVKEQKFCPFCGVCLQQPATEQNSQAQKSEIDLSAVDEMLKDDSIPTTLSKEGSPEKGVPHYLHHGTGEEVPPALEHSRASDNLDYPWRSRESKEFLPSREGYCPWEDQERLGFFSGIGRTVYETFTKPAEFFARMPVRGGLLVPLLYALIVSTTGTMLGYLWLFSTENSFVSAVNQIENFTIIMGIMTPVALLVSIVGWALIIHGCLHLLGGARRDFEATFRVVCYASGPELWNILPFLGSYISYGWRLYLFVVGLREVHGLSTGRAVAAVLLPSIGCLSSVMALAVFWKMAVEAAVK